MLGGLFCCAKHEWPAASGHILLRSNGTFLTPDHSGTEDTDAIAGRLVLKIDGGSVELPEAAYHDGSATFPNGGVLGVVTNTWTVHRLVLAGTGLNGDPWEYVEGSRVLLGTLSWRSLGITQLRNAPRLYVDGLDPSGPEEIARLSDNSQYASAARYHTITGPYISDPTRITMRRRREAFGNGHLTATALIYDNFSDSFSRNYRTDDGRTISANDLVPPDGLDHIVVFQTSGAASFIGTAPPTWVNLD